MSQALLRIGFFLIVILSSFISKAQRISGKIIDAYGGQPIPYASVYIKNSNEGVSSNAEGNYSFTTTPGKKIIVCQHLGFAKVEREIIVGNADVTVDFSLSQQIVELEDVVVSSSGENYAYTVIREAIKKRKEYQAEYQQFYCEVYTKGQMRLRDYPKKLFGQKVDFEDGDTSKKKVLFLSETVSQYSVAPPNKSKIEVIRSKVSGNSDGYGLSVPTIFSLYDNQFFVSEQLNPRGFVSPIADNALHFYNYKYLGSFIEDGKEINKVQIIPKRKFEPLCSGTISIVEDEWRIHSVDIVMDKTSQLQLLDTLRLQQLYRPVEKDKWAIATQIISPSAKFFGFDSYGSFVNVYTLFDMNPQFASNHFTNTIIKYLRGANAKDSAYWEENRPIPLKEDEIADYKKKDSLEVVWNSPAYKDSVDRVRNKLKPMSLVLGYSYAKSMKRISFQTGSVISSLNFNPIEGLVIDAPIRFSKGLDTVDISIKRFSAELGLRYGFSNGHFNPRLSTTYQFGKKGIKRIKLSGGKLVSQFNKSSTIDPKGNTWTTLIGKNNQLKIYEAYFGDINYTAELGNGLWGTISLNYEDRMPLENSTNFSFNKRKKQVPYTPNYPYEIVSTNIDRHQATLATVQFSWQPHSMYIEYPDRKINIGSKYPVFRLQYQQAIKGLFKSDVDFAKWRFDVTDDINFKLQGIFSYKVGFGGFLYKNQVQVPDYMHFNGNESVNAVDFLSSFQLLPVYKFSNTKPFYALAHMEHNFKGALTNKIPGFRKLNLYLVVGANTFYVDHKSSYFEAFVGLDNILKNIRVDYVHGFINGKSFTSGFRVGLSRNSIFRGR